MGLLFVLGVSLKFWELIVFNAIMLIHLVCIFVRRQSLILVKLIEICFTALNSFLLRLRMYSRRVIIPCSILTTIILFHWINLIEILSFCFVVWDFNTFWNSFIVFNIFKNFIFIFCNLLTLNFCNLFVFTLSQIFFFLINRRFTRHLRNLIIFLSNVFVFIVAMIIILRVFDNNRKIHPILRLGSFFNILSANHLSLNCFSNKFLIIFAVSVAWGKFYDQIVATVCLRFYHHPI